MVEKMELLHITGPKNDIDRVMDVYLSNYEIHFENASASLGGLSNVRPFAETNVYKEAYQRAKNLWEYMEEIPKESGVRLKPDEAEQIVDTVWELAGEVREQREVCKRERLQLEELMQQLEPFRELDYEFRRLLEFRFIAFRFGRISRDNYQRLERYIHETDHALFYECHSDAEYVWGVYFVPQKFKSEVDAVCMSFHFERIYLPDSFEGTPDAAYLRAQEQLSGVREAEERLCQRLQETFCGRREELEAAYASLETYCDYFDVRKYAVCTRRRSQETSETDMEHYILYGWMSRRDAGRFLKEVEQDDRIHVIVEDATESIKATPPTKLRNPKLFAPFELFVEMYGLPAYHEMDPTVFIALTYTFMFGAMFGDVGQGACLMLGGIVLYVLKKLKLAAIIALAGGWSVFFGFMYGSLFGFEDVLPALWMRPMDDIMTTLLIAVAFGMGLILFAMLLNIINAIRARDLGRVLFSQSGIAGLVCYGGAVFCIVLFVTGHALPAAGVLGVLLAAPLAAIFLKEPLERLIERKQHIFPEGSKVMFFLEAFVELFDVVLSYATNSISFVRVGAFALSHAGMMGVVLTLAGYESGETNWLIVVLGNILVTALEGLVVGIQVLRLEYYEMFGRFYQGTGRPFVSFFQKKEMGGKKTWR